VGPDRPEYEPRGCPCGAAFSGPFGQDSGRGHLPLVSVESFHALRRRRTADSTADPAEAKET
jgi:nitrate reductase beta subunit